MEKSAAAFRTIGEVAEWLDEETHVLRFWESKFSHVKPVKRAGGRRYYRPSDMLLLGGLKKLLHEDGMTIKGAQKVLRAKGVDHVSSLSRPLPDPPSDKTSSLDQSDRHGNTDAAPSAERPDSKASATMDAKTLEKTDIQELTSKDIAREPDVDVAAKPTEWPLPPLQLGENQIVPDKNAEPQFSSSAKTKSDTIIASNEDASQNETGARMAEKTIDATYADMKTEQSATATSTGQSNSNTIAADGTGSDVSPTETPDEPTTLENNVPKVWVPKDPVYRNIVGPSGLLTRLMKISALPKDIDPKIVSEVIGELKKVTDRKPI